MGQGFVAQLFFATFAWKMNNYPMQEPHLNEHNKAEYPPMHIGGFDTSLKNVNTLECVYQFVRLFFIAVR